MSRWTPSKPLTLTSVYEQVDHLFKSYYAPMQSEFQHVTSIPLGYKRGFWSQEPLGGRQGASDGPEGPTHAIRSREGWRGGYRHAAKAASRERHYFWNFIGNVLASRSRVEMFHSIERDGDFFESIGPGFTRLTRMWNDEREGMSLSDYRQVWRWSVGIRDERQVPLSAVVP
jgi:hypothetical protein